ncbi:MAG: alpha/beta fold hydrolase [Myxococcota bacterium]
MVAHPIAMPKLGMTMEEGTVLQWPLGPGQRVEKGQTIVVIESEKTEAEIEATVSGTLRHVYVGPEETVPCGTLLAAITDSPDEPFDADAFRVAHPSPQVSAKREPTPPTRSAGSSGRPVASRQRRAIAPAARALARRLGVDPERASGTGPGGRVTREDVQRWARGLEHQVEVAEGVCLEVPSEGRGPELLLLPGFGTDVSSFARQIPALASMRRVRGVNPRGVAHSDAPAEELYSIERAAEDVAALAGQAGEPVDLVGASLGAAVALEVAIVHPGRVRSLSLLTPLVQVSPRLDCVLEAWCRVAAEAAPDTLARVLLPWLFSPVLLAEPSARTRMHRGLSQTVARVPATTLERAARGLRAWSGSRADDLGSISAPTLILVAGQDLLAPDGEAIARAIGDARCVRVPEAGHALGLEAAERVNEAICAHLAGRTDAAGG